MLGATIRLGRSGGTGRRAGLKIPCPSGRVGSTPTSGTGPKRVFMRNPSLRPRGPTAANRVRATERATGREPGDLGAMFCALARGIGCPLVEEHPGDEDQRCEGNHHEHSARRLILRVVPVAKARERTLLPLAYASSPPTPGPMSVATNRSFEIALPFATRITPRIESTGMPTIPSKMSRQPGDPRERVTLGSLEARLAAIEEALARIEAQLARQAAGSRASSPRTRRR